MVLALKCVLNSTSSLYKCCFLLLVYFSLPSDTLPTEIPPSVNAGVLPTDQCIQRSDNLKPFPDSEY